MDQSRHHPELESRTFREKVLRFVHSRAGQVAGEYSMCLDGQVTLYSSCFAAMTLHYLNGLDDVGQQGRQAWAEYIKQWQDPETGRFIGPEIAAGELHSELHDWDHITMHLTAHALPALDLLGARPSHPLRFAHSFLDKRKLLAWLDGRNWRLAWLEGNNLLFMGQFLLWLRDVERQREAAEALHLYFDWLDREQDPVTGLWGTNGHCDPYAAMYGAYHQLLVYYFCGRRVPYAERIIDTTLGLQHSDGSFARAGGGGSCEDVDAVDILVNLYKRTGYRSRAVRVALEGALESVLTEQMPDGGFVYRRGAVFSHMGIARTHVPPNTSEMFSTWFRVHTVALACQVLQEHPLSRIGWQFNKTCSMGWHKPLKSPEPQKERWFDRLPLRCRVVRKGVERVRSVVKKRGKTDRQSFRDGRHDPLDLTAGNLFNKS